MSEILNKKGWNLNNLQFPSSVHICVTYRHTEEGMVEQFLSDVREIANELKKDPTAAPKGSVSFVLIKSVHNA